MRIFTLIRNFLNRFSCFFLWFIILLSFHNHFLFLRNGNVALDVARILLKTPEELALTDIPLHVREALKKSKVQRVGVYGRRGPVQGAYTIAEFREITTAALRPVIAPFNPQDAIDLGFDASTFQDIEAGTDVIRSGLIIPQGNFNRGLNPASEEEATARALKRKTDLIRSLPAKAQEIGIHVATEKEKNEHKEAQMLALSEVVYDPETSPPNKPIPNDRTLVLDYLMRPVKFLSEDGTHLSYVLFERTELKGDAGKQTLVDTGDFVKIPFSNHNSKLLVLKSVGYRTTSFENIPFDQKRNVFPTSEGGRLSERGQVIPGLYATGWARRGPTGIIGTNIGDARETAGSVCDDLIALQEQGLTKAAQSSQSLEDFWNDVEQKTVVVDKQAVKKIHKYECSLGQSHNVNRIKVAALNDLLAISQVKKDTSGSRN